MDPALFAKQIAAAGYQARKDDVRLTMRGTVKKEGAQLLFMVADVKPGPQVFVLQAAASKDAKEQAAFAAAFAELERYSTSTPVEVEALWKGGTQKDERATLLVRAVRAVKP